MMKNITRKLMTKYFQNCHYVQLKNKDKQSYKC